jgi:hypothetical protein
MSGDEAYTIEEMIAASREECLASQAASTEGVLISPGVEAIDHELAQLEGKTP